MEMRKQGEGQGTARSASKSPAGGRKQTQASSPATEQENQGSAGQQTRGDEDLLKHAKQATGQIVNRVQERAGSQLNQQKQTAASQLSQVANAVRRIRENLPEQEGGAIARYVADYGDKAANSIERLSNYIREQDPRQVLNDVQNFGRRRPALLVGGAFLLGFAGARLIRSSMNAGSQQQRNVQLPSANVASRPSTTPNAL